MLELHPQILKKDGEEQFVVLPWQEFLSIREAVEDVEDMRELRLIMREEADAPTTSHEELGRQLGFVK